MSDHPAIECAPNGPYLVRNLADLRDAQGGRIDTQPVVALCRCGGSANKPFCDGTHGRNGFSDEKRPARMADRRDSYRAGSLTIHDNRSICAHAGHCTDGLDSVFRQKSEPWIDPAGASPEAIEEIVHHCPSGALSYTLDGVDGGDPRREPAITVTHDGPYAVVGSVELRGQPMAIGASSEHYTLCRCGASKNKPFCDGTHWDVGFKG